MSVKNNTHKNKTKQNKTRKNKTIKNKTKRNIYIFLYGALMNSCSRKKTLQHIVENKPCILLKKFGYTRCLCVESKQKNEIYLGIIKSTKSKDINGSLINIKKLSTLNKLKKREIYYYLKQIPNDCMFLPDELNKNDKIYTFIPYSKYITNNKKIETYNNVKEYTEKVMMGYQSISDEYLQTFLNTTDNFFKK